MKQENFTLNFVEWVRANQASLNADHIAVRMPEKIIGTGTYADFLAPSGESTVEIWDYGFSEFHVLDPQTGQINTTHYEFRDVAEMYAALDELVNRLSPALVTK